METETVAGIKYSLPQVTLLQETGIGTAEVSARTCYDSFDSSEHEAIRYFNDIVNKELREETLHNNLNQVNNIKKSDLLDKLAWAYHHHSILEHANLTYLIKGTSRSVLQEHARHRLQAISVRSTRYTMQDILHAFNTSMLSKTAFSKQTFIGLIKPMQMFVVQNQAEILEINTIYDKLFYQLQTLGRDEFIKLTMSKSAQDIFTNHYEFESLESLFSALCDAKAKRNVGDNFKWIVTDNWKVDMVVTFNLRSLKNYLTLRDSGAAYFQIQWLAQAMKAVTPNKYLNLIVKEK